MYGSRFFDILVLDALYAQTAVFELAEKIGWDLVISLKQNQPDLYQSAIRLFARRPPDCSYTEKHDGKTYEVQLWDTPGLPFSGKDPRLVRVVRSEERVTEIITARANSSPRPPRTNGSGPPLWSRRYFPPKWCEGLGMTAGN